MNMYQCKLIEDGCIKENFFREAESAKEILDELRMFQYEGEWEIYLNDELEISGTA